MENRFSGHSVYRAQYHIVWATKYRRRILKPGLKSYLDKMLKGMMRTMPGCEVEELNVQEDHLHMVMIIPPKYAVSDVIARMKSRTASYMRRKFKWLEKVYWKENVVWSPGYFVSTVGLDEEQIKEYVKWQGAQDSGQAKLAF
jgi:putative transposase